MTMKPMVIMLGHKMQRGKDTAGSHLVRKYGFTRVAFADEIKEICKVMYDFTEEQLYGSQKCQIDSRYGITPRQVFQEVGEENRRRDQDVWARMASKKVIPLLEQNKSVVITDFRYPNEFNCIQSIVPTGVKVYPVEIKRPEMDDNSELTNTEHVSETALDGFNWLVSIYNTGTIDKLYQRIDRFILGIQRTEWDDTNYRNFSNAR